MPHLTFIEPDGTKYEVEAEEGQKLIQIAINNMVPIMTGDCGGACACGTCHGHIDDIGLYALPPIGSDEEAMLQGVVGLQPNSRLLCQLKMQEQWDGMIVRIPPEY